jgi:hypothetical protein
MNRELVATAPADDALVDIPTPRYLAHLSKLASIWQHNRTNQVSLAPVSEVYERSAAHRMSSPDIALTSPTLLRHRNHLFPALQTCFGEELRSKSLGLRHVDKSIYYDQLVRWLLNFHPNQFIFLPTTALHNAPHASMHQLLSWLQPRLRRDMVESIDYSNVKLSSPNRRRSQTAATQLLPAKEMHTRLQRFFKPYDLALKNLLG